jgi:hypothetical protein
MPKNPYVQLSDSYPPPSPILLNANFIEIIPRGKEFAMIIQRSHGVGDVVARGSYLYEAKIGSLGLPAV